MLGQRTNGCLLHNLSPLRNKWRMEMAKKIIFVSDLSGKELDANSAVRVTVAQ